MAVTINGTTGIANDGGYTGDGVVFADTTPSNTLVTTTGGNVGIGTSSPATKLEVTGDITQTWAASADRFVGSKFSTTYELGLHFIEASRETRIVSKAADSSGLVSFYTGVTPTERARIDSSGNLLVGTTSSADATGNTTRFSVVASGGSNDSAINVSGFGDAYGFGIKSRLRSGSSGNAGWHNRFYDSNGAVVGGIYSNGSTTSFSTSSDYRLKHDVQPLQNALARLAALNPVTYKWNADGSDGEGFIAHELAEVVPDAVTGEKDAVNEDGSIRPQGIDTSFLVATLTAAIQEQQAIITALTARVTALEGA